MLTKQIKYIISAILILFIFTTPSFAGELTEQTSFRHGVSELGNIQIYLVTDIVEDGKIISSNRSIAYTPENISNMKGWDDKSKNIVKAITAKEVKDAFNLEKQEKTGNGIEKIITYDRTINDLECISIRQVTRIFKDGKEISKKYHRSWINPGDDPIKKDVISKAIAQKLHTPEVIKKYKEKQKERL